MVAKVLVTQFALRTTNGTTDVTIPGAEDAYGECKGAVFIMSGGVTNGTTRATCKMSIGWVDTSKSNAVGVTLVTENGVNDTHTSKAWSAQYCIVAYNDGANILDGQYSSSAFISNGIEITTTNPATTAHLVTAILFFGSDITTEAGSITPGFETPVNGETIVTIGQKSDLLFWSRVGSTLAADTNGTAAIGNFAISTWDGTTIRQRGFRVRNRNNQSTSDVNQILGPRLDYNFGSLPTVNRAMECTTMEGTGTQIGITSRENVAPSDRPYRFLSVNFNGVLEARVEPLTLPTAGSFSSVAYGFKPQFMLFAFILDATQKTEANSAEINQDDRTVIGVMDGDREFSVGCSDEDGVGTSNTDSVSNNNVLYSRDPGDTVVTDFDFGSFDTSGFTCSNNTNPSFGLAGFGLAIQEIAILRRIFLM